MDENTQNISDELISDTDVIESRGETAKETDQYGIAVVVRSEYIEVVHEETGEHLGYYGDDTYCEVLLNPAKSGSESWLSYEEAHERIREEYDTENPGKYISRELDIDLSEHHVVLLPIRHGKLRFIQKSNSVK